MLFVSLNITNTHWVMMVIDIFSWYIYIFDSDLLVIVAEKMKVIVKPFVHMVLKILEQSGMFDHFLKVREEVPLLYSWARDKLPSYVTS